MTAGRKSTQNKQNWNTPSKYADVVHKFFDNELFLDPCSNSSSIIISKLSLALPLDSLSIEWNFPTIFINPPYGRDKERGTTIKNWIIKAWESHIEFGSEILMLIPVATNTSHWKEFIFGKGHICFLSDTRLKFRIGGNERNKGAPMPCAMIYYGENIQKFQRYFGNFGHVSENV